MCDIKGCGTKSFYKFEELDLSVCFECFIKIQDGILNEKYKIVKEK